MLGFTMIELMITIAIATILLALAIPNFTRFIRQSQYTSAGNELVTGFNYARNEAINRQRAVAIAANGGAWINGWQAFLDTNRNAVFDGTDVVLRQGNAITGIDITSSFTAAAFDQNGRRTQQHFWIFRFPKQAALQTWCVEFVLHETGEFRL